jgi:hypothetical protein
MNSTPLVSIATSLLRSLAPANGLATGVDAGWAVDHRSASAFSAREVRASAAASRKGASP